MRIVKKGSMQGKLAIVEDPNWEGTTRVLLSTTDSKNRPCKRSYFGHHLERVKEAGPVESELAQQRCSLKTKSIVSDKTKMLLAYINEWTFDALALQQGLLQEKGSDGASEVLLVVGDHLFACHGVETELGVSTVRTQSFLQKIEALYLPNPYHNAMHGA